MCSIKHMHLKLIRHSTINGQLGCFHILALVDMAAINFGLFVLLRHGPFLHRKVKALQMCLLEYKDV